MKYNRLFLIAFIIWIIAACHLGGCAPERSASTPAPESATTTAIVDTGNDPLQARSNPPAAPTSDLPAPVVQPFKPAVIIPPQPAPPNVPEKSRIIDCREETVTLVSKTRKKVTRFNAFVPVSPGVSDRFPVLYLLHGAWDGYSAWKDHARDRLCELARQYGLIIITPDGDPFGWYADSEKKPDNQIESYFMDELMPYVETNFPVNGRRSIAGLSMGGTGPSFWPCAALKSSIPSVP